MKFVTDWYEFCESYVPRHEARRTTVTSEKHAKIWLRKVSANFSQFLVDILDGDSFTVRILITVNSLPQQLIELCVSIFRRVQIHDDVSLVSVSMWKFDSICGRLLIIWAPNDVFTVALVGMLFNGLVKRRRELVLDNS